MNKVQNVRTLARLKRALALAPVVILPLGLAGVAVRPALDLRRAVREEGRLTRLVEHCDHLRAELELFDGAGRVQELESLRGRLRALIPSQLAPIEVYSYLRECARQCGLELEVIQIGVPKDLELVLDGETIVELPVTLRGRGTLRAVALIPRVLDARGLLCAVRSARVTSGETVSETYQFELGVGLFHCASAASAGSDDSTTMDMPTGPMEN